MENVSTADKPNQPTPRGQPPAANFSNLSAVELGAKRGIGPLSPLGRIVWHGETRPCVSCGQLVRRTSGQCDQCGQLMSGEMIRKMRLYSGPWYVLEHVRPFPGVALDRLIKQIKRGVLTPTTIVRGPSTHHQWRYAGETPGLSKHLGLCWACQTAVREEESNCPVCRRSLDTDGEDALIEGDETLPTQSPELSRLKAAVGNVSTLRGMDDQPARVGPLRASWLITGLVLVLMIAVYWIVSLRENDLAPAAKNTPATQPIQRIATDGSALPAKPGQPQTAVDVAPDSNASPVNAKPPQD